MQQEQGPLELAFAYVASSQTQDASPPEIAGRLEQARTAALLSIAESLAVMASAAVEQKCEGRFPL